VHLIMTLLSAYFLWLTLRYAYCYVNAPVIIL
jgi:hypothetical protein